MDTGRPTKTAADYMVIAISPVLIMLVVHSFCFFLVDVFYRGEAIGGVRWVLFWFVLAVVLIARIGIEQGEAQSIGYSLALTFAVLFYLMVQQTNVVFAAILLGLVWFTAHKLTANCTLIDEDDDASGQGLLQSLRQLPLKLKKTPPAAAALPVPPLPPLAARSKKKRKPQTPGAWLLYYSLAAVPIFGFGQTLLPADDLTARHRAFVYLCCYLAGALGLLITTSFLGLRRYLRQRYVAMPGKIALGWIQTGAIAAGIVLCVALLLPRPGAREAWITLRYHVDNQLRRASDYALRFNPHGTGHGRASNQDSSNGQQEDKSGAGGDSSQNSKENGNSKGQGGQQSGGNSGEGGGGNQQPHDNGQGQAGNQGANGEQKNPPQANPPPEQTGDGPSGVSAKPSASPAPSSSFSWLRILFWLAVAAGLAWVMYRYRAMILAMLQGVWTAIRDFITKLLALFKPSSSVRPLGVKKPGAIPFKTFKNPFFSGGAQTWPPEKLITYSFEALQSWVLENKAVHGSPQTPREFCHQLGEEIPDAADALDHLAFLYGHVAYGASVPGSYNPEQLRLIWDYMARPRVKSSSAPIEENELAGTI